MSNMENNLPIIGFEGEDVIAFGKQMYKVEHIASALTRQIGGSIANSINAVINKSDGITIPQQAFTGGYACEVLGAHSKGWKKGKFKVKLEIEFVPDQLEEIGNDEPSKSDLDALRAVVDSE